MAKLYNITFEGAAGLNLQALFNALQTLGIGRVSLTAFLEGHEVPDREFILAPEGIDTSVPDEKFFLANRFQDLFDSIQDDGDDQYVALEDVKTLCRELTGVEIHDERAEEEEVQQ